MDQRELAAAMRFQGEWCAKLGSPLYHSLYFLAADDIEAGGACWKVLESHAAEATRRSILPLRFFAAVHRLVLEGALPGTTWTAFLETIDRHAALIRSRIPATVQTNEVGRSNALLPGFLEVMKQTGLPLRLLEAGCSAGLNLRVDHLLNRPDLKIVQRRGCDLNPIELDEDGRLTLLSFVWPDQTQRFEQLARAIEIGRRVPAVIEKADAVDWIERQLANSAAGVATVVYHSIVMMYFSVDARERFSRILGEAGARATADAPLAWLSMEPSMGPAGEPGVEQAAVDLTMWPGGEKRRIATAGYHGQNVVVK